MMETNVNKEIRRLKNLKNYRKKSDSEIEEIARFNCWHKDIKIDDRFSDKDEKLKAVDIFDSYLHNYDFQNFNEVKQLSDLVYSEILARRIEKDINKIMGDENSKFVPDKPIKALQEVRKEIDFLKERLGISKSKEQDDLTALETLKKRFEVYIPFNRNEFTTTCHKCGTLLLLRRRCGEKDFENLIHPMFSGRFWYNRRGIELVKKGIWTKDQYAFVFFTSPQYVDWCIENENKIVEINNVEQDKINEFIKNNPFLKDVTVPSKILEQTEE